MKLGVCVEVSSRTRTKDILSALDRARIEYINLGMSEKADEPELTYIDTGFISALALSLKAVDMIVGGCGTGQGYLNSVIQYPGVVAGLVLEPVDAFLFSQINAGNVVSLALNKGYGTFGADLNLDYIFEKLFCTPSGNGYPESRAESQAQSRVRLGEISRTTHLSMSRILEELDPAFVMRCLSFPGFMDCVENAPDSQLKDEVMRFYRRGGGKQLEGFA